MIGHCESVMVPSSKISVCVSSSGVLRLRSVRRLQPGLLHDSGPKQPAQLVEVHAPPSSSSFSSSSSLSSTLTNTGSQKPTVEVLSALGKREHKQQQPASPLKQSTTMTSPLLWSCSLTALGGAACDATGQVMQSSPLKYLK